MGSSRQSVEGRSGADIFSRFSLRCKARGSVGLGANVCWCGVHKVNEALLDLISYENGGDLAKFRPVVVLGLQMGNPGQWVE